MLSQNSWWIKVLFTVLGHNQIYHKKLDLYFWLNFDYKITSLWLKFIGKVFVYSSSCCIIQTELYFIGPSYDIKRPIEFISKGKWHQLNYQIVLLNSIIIWGFSRKKERSIHPACYWLSFSWMLMKLNYLWLITSGGHTH